MAYVYRHIRLDTCQPFYIGKGVDNGFYRAYDKSRRNKHWQKIVSSAGMKVDILLYDISEEEAKKKEIEFIALYGRADLGLGTLINLTDGGDGGKNWCMTPDQRKRLSENHKEQYKSGKKTVHRNFSHGIKVSPTLTPEIIEIRRQNGYAKKGTNLSDSTKQRIRAKLLGVKPVTTQRIVRCDLQGHVIESFQGSNDAAKSVAGQSSKIRCCLRGEKKTYKGFLWKLIE